MSDDIHIYCLSNGSEKMFPNNTLTNFSVSLPFIIKNEKSDKTKWFVALESIGFHANFMSNSTIIDINVPSVIILNNQNFGSVCTGVDSMPSYCNTTLLDEAVNNNYGRVKYHTYYFQDGKDYNELKYFSFIKNLENISAINFRYSKVEDNFYITAKPEHTEDIILLFHLKLMNNIAYNCYAAPGANFSDIKQFSVVSINNISYMEFTINQKQYMIFQIVKDNIKPVLPNVVKLKSSFIREQIYDNTLAKDLICYAPKIINNEFSFFNVESKHFVQLSNTFLNSLDFKLTNEKDKLLNLNDGIATVLKLHFKKMLARNKSFHVRLSSDKSPSMSSFKVKLPQTLYFNREWNVAISSILIPGRFSTCPNLNEIKFFYRNNKQETIEVKTYMPRLEYTKETLFNFINNFLSNRENRKNLGSVEEKLDENEYEPTVHFKFQQEGIFVLPQELCYVLGYGAADFIDGKKRFAIKIPEGQRNYKLKMSVAMNLNYFKPNYIMAYSNIVEPTPVNSEMTNLLKVFPITNEKSHKLYEFKHLEYHRLLNNEIDEIAIDLRNHAGELVTFEVTKSNQVIVNLLFTNYHQ